MKAIVNKPQPVVQPPATVTITMTLEEANILQAANGYILPSEYTNSFERARNDNDEKNLHDVTNSTVRQVVHDFYVTLNRAVNETN